MPRPVMALPHSRANAPFAMAPTIRKTVHDGNGNMPPFGEQLSDDEITQVIKYVRHFGKVAKK